jgi:hypothetical protein
VPRWLTPASIAIIDADAPTREARRAKVDQGMNTISIYRFLQKHLEDRFADTVVLSMGQIEDLLGFALPAHARTDPAWWTNAGDALAPQAEAWRLAHRMATPNLRAGNVAFERIS